MRKSYHVTKDRETGEWNVKKAGGERASGHAATQAEAERMAKQLASNSGGGEVVIHRPDGTIRDSDTVAPANDPAPPIDKKH